MVTFKIRGDKLHSYFKMKMAIVKDIFCIWVVILCNFIMKKEQVAIAVHSDK